MIFNRNEIINKYPWINKTKQRFIISADYDGLICASLLNHHKNWDLVGYYDLESIWISKEAQEHKNDIIWVDLNILPQQGRAIGGHIVSIKNESPEGFYSSCNPNLLAGIDIFISIVSSSHRPGIELLNGGDQIHKRDTFFPFINSRAI